MLCCCSKSILKGIVNGNVKMFVKFAIVRVRVRGLKSHCAIIDHAVQAADLHVTAGRNRIHCIDKQILILNGIQLRWQVNVKLGQRWLNGDWSSVMNGKRLINDEWRVRSVRCWCCYEIILIDRLGHCYQWTIRHSLINAVGKSVHIGRCWPTIESVI